MNRIERVFLRVMMAVVALALLGGAVWGPVRIVELALGAGPPRPGETIPRQITYRGFLERDSVPVSGQLEIGFTLVSTDGGTTWRESHVVQVASGHFSADIGEDGGIPAVLLDDPGVSLSVQVQPSTNGPILAGSQRLLSVPFSQRALLAQRAQAASTATDVLATQVVPPGVVSAFAGTVPPVGWLLCDGRAVDRGTYAALFGAIGTSSGVGNGTTTFNLPDYRGRFLRGVDNGAGRDVDSATRIADNGGNAGSQVGSAQPDELRSHQHPLMILSGSSTGGGAYNVNANGTNWQLNGSLFPFGGIAAGVGGVETRPTNVYVNFIVKY
ncbi:MAG: tail fiber protein [Archangium sp.]|nr:tail fiber protein [Archangium sp.]